MFVHVKLDIIPICRVQRAVEIVLLIFAELFTGTIFVNQETSKEGAQNYDKTQ